jgi:hypothetical protein
VSARSFAAAMIASCLMAVVFVVGLWWEIVVRFGRRSVVVEENERRRWGREFRWMAEVVDVREDGRKKLLW